MKILCSLLPCLAIVVGHARVLHAERPVSLSGHIGDVQCVRFSPDGQWIVSVTPHDAVKVWDVESRGLVTSLGDRRGDAYHSAAFSPDGSLLAACGLRELTGDDGRGAVTLWNTTTWQVERILEKGARGDLAHVEFLPDGKRVAAGGGSPTTGCFVWDVASGELIAEGPHMAPQLRFGVTPDGQSLISAEVVSSGYDARGNWHGTSRVVAWYVGADEVRTQLGELAGYFTSVAASPYNHHFAAGGGSDAYGRTRPGELVLWDRSGRATSLKGHRGTVLAVAFSLDGRLLASGGKDGTIRIWDVSAAKLVRQLRGHRGDVQAVAFSPDGRLFASGGEDRSVRLWQIDD